MPLSRRLPNVNTCSSPQREPSTPPATGAARAPALILGALFVLSFFLSGSARAESRAMRGLLFDMRKIVDTQESIGWKIDKYEIEDMMPDALYSVCRAPKEARTTALAAARKRIRRLGGPVTQALKSGKAFADLPKKLISASRVEMLLSEASKRASTECSLGLDPDPDFAGNESSAHRFTLNLEGGGLFVAQRSAQQNYLGAGGTGRLLLGYGLSERRTVLMGLEFGGNALFQRDEDSINFPLQFTGAAPLVLRHHHLSFHHDLELAPIVYFTEADTRPSFGGRAGVTLGVSTLRIHNIMPWAGAGFSLEFMPENSHRPTVVALKGGARVGFNWDF